MEDPIFIVGLPRSGSTLWLNVFAKNPEIFRIGEMLFLTPFRKDFRYFLKKIVGDLNNKKQIEKMINLVFSEKVIPGITASFWINDIKKMDKQQLKENLILKIDNSDKTLKSIFNIIIEEITIFNGFQRCCTKFPVYVNHVPALIEWWPECKIAHITRDPRAIVISRKNDPGGTQLKIKKHPGLKNIIRNTMTIFVMLQYIWTSKLHCKYKKYDNYRLFKYEDLLSNPETVIKELCDFTKIDFNQDMLLPEKGQASSITGKKQKGFNREAAYHWKNVIKPFEERLITFFTKKSMQRFDYDYRNQPIIK